MTEYGLKKVILQSGNSLATPKSTALKSPWNGFLNTLDSNPKLSDKEVMMLFAKTLSMARSDWKDSNDNTLLMHMASRGRIGVVKRLIHELYANVNAVNKDGTTALHMSARSGHADVCTELINASANPSAKDNNKLTPAQMAHEMGYKDIEKFLKQEETGRKLWQCALSKKSR